MTRTFEWGVGITTFSSVLNVVPCHCARLPYFLHPKLRKTTVVLMQGFPLIRKRIFTNISESELYLLIPNIRNFFEHEKGGLF